MRPILRAAAAAIRAAERAHCKVLGHTMVGLPLQQLRCIRCGAR